MIISEIGVDMSRFPTAAHLAFVGRSEVLDRCRGDPATGRPLTPVFVQMTGAIRINASRTRGYTYPSRSIGVAVPGETPQGIALSPEVVAEIVDQLDRIESMTFYQEDEGEPPTR